MIDLDDIGDCIGRRRPVSVDRRKRIAIALERGDADTFTMCGGKGMGKIIRPVARGLNYVGLDIGDRLGECLAGFGFYDEMQPGQNFVGKLGVKRRYLSAISRSSAVPIWKSSSRGRVSRI